MNSPYLNYSECIERYLKEISKTVPLKSDEEIKLSKLIKKGDRKAFNKLIKANLLFVVKVALNYQNQGVPLEDLISSGNKGLIRAVKKFDGSKNFKFISYAVWWIRQAILEELANHSRIVRLPSSGVSKIENFSKVHQKMLKSKKGVVHLEDLAQELKTDTRGIEALMGLSARALALDSEILNSGGTILDSMAAPEEEDPLDKDSKKKIAEQVICRLPTERERYVMKRYFGLDDLLPQTLEEIAATLDISRERVRQIKRDALVKLQGEFSSNFVKVMLG